MKYSGINSFILIKNIFLAEPISDDGRKAMRNLGVHIDEHEFFHEKKGMYTEPFTLYTKQQTDELNDDPDLTQNDVDNIDSNALHLKKIRFENKLKHLMDSLFIIKGVAGSGKTTYLHYLKLMFSNCIKFHIIDFETLKQADALWELNMT